MDCVESTREVKEHVSYSAPSALQMKLTNAAGR